MGEVEKWFFKNHRQIVKKGRYLGHSEDEPLLWQRQFDALGEAVEQTRSRVLDRLLQNGCGDGALLDLHSLEILTCFHHAQTPDEDADIKVGEFPAPENEAERDRMVSRILSQFGGFGGPFVWETWSG